MGLDRNYSRGMAYRFHAPEGEGALADIRAINLTVLLPFWEHCHSKASNHVCRPCTRTPAGHLQKAPK